MGAASAKWNMSMMVLHTRTGLLIWTTMSSPGAKVDIGGGATIQAFCAAVRVAHRAVTRVAMSFMGDRCIWRLLDAATQPLSYLTVCLEHGTTVGLQRAVNGRVDAPLEPTAVRVRRLFKARSPEVSGLLPGLARPSSGRELSSHSCLETARQRV